MMNFNDETLVIIDIRDELKLFSSFNSGYKIYEKISLREIIENILTIPALDYDCDSYIWDVLSNRLDLDRTEDQYDLQVIDIFIDTLAQTLDEKLRNAFPREIDYSLYVLDRWVDNTSILMKKYEYFRLTNICSGKVNKY